MAYQHQPLLSGSQGSHQIVAVQGKAVGSNPILSKVGENRLSFVIDFPSCCGDIVYKFSSPQNPTAEVFRGVLNRPCCGDATIPIQDTAGMSIMTPTINEGCCVTWAVKDGSGKVVGNVRDPTCVQSLSATCLPCADAVRLRATDENGNDRFTLRSPGCCSGLTNCSTDCCNTRCPRCQMLNCCVCDSAWFMDIPVFAGNMDDKMPIAKIEWHGIRSCCTKRILSGYKTTITFPPQCSYNDTCLLVLLAIFADYALVWPMRQPAK